MKTCTECQQHKPLDQFRPRKLANSMGLTSGCRECHAKRNKQYRRVSRIQNIERKREWYFRDKASNPTKASNTALVRKYGITLEQKTEMWLAQNKTCAICPKALNTLFEAKTDHNHKTGKVRQLLCAKCNAHLGYIKEDFGIALKLAKYIQEHNGVE
jgi:hypothetical protein